MLRIVTTFTWLSAGMVLLLDAPLAAQQVRLPSDQQLRVFGLELEWHTQVSMDPLRDTVRDIAFDGTQLYVQTDQGVIHAIATDSAGTGSAPGRTGGGQTAWISQVGTPGLPSYRPAANSREVFVVHGSKLFVLDKHTGKHLWRAELPGAPSSPLAASDNYAYVGFIDGQLRAYDLRGPSEAWYYRTGETISVPALPLDDRVAFASQDGTLYVSVAGQRELVFEFETDYPVSSELAHRGDLIYLASQDFNVYCINARAGTTVWRRSLGEPITRPLVVIDDEVYVTPDTGGLHRLNADTGVRQWQFRRARGFVAASPSHVYASDSVGRLLILDRATGRPKGFLDLEAFPTRVVNDLNDRLFLCSRNGLMICLHESNLQQPAFHEAAAKPVVAEPPVAEPNAEQVPEP